MYFSCIFQGLFTILIWLVSTSYQSSAAETTDHEARQGRSQVDCNSSDKSFDLHFLGCTLQTHSFQRFYICKFVNLSIWLSRLNHDFQTEPVVAEPWICFIREPNLPEERIYRWNFCLSLSVVTSSTAKQFEKKIFMQNNKQKNYWVQAAVDWLPFWMTCLAQREQWISSRTTFLR